jgi:hypothetical protein
LGCFVKLHKKELTKGNDIGSSFIGGCRNGNLTKCPNTNGYFTIHKEQNEISFKYRHTCSFVESLSRVRGRFPVFSQGPSERGKRLLLPHLHLDLADGHGRRRHVQVEAVAVAAFDGCADLAVGVIGIFVNCTHMVYQTRER